MISFYRLMSFLPILLYCFFTTGALSEYEYALVYMKNIVAETAVQQDVELYIASRSVSNVTVTVDNPDGSFISGPITFELAPDTVNMQILPADIRLDDGYSNKAVRVVGSGDIIVYGLNRNLYSTDGFTAFRVDQTGTEYYALAYTPLTATQIALVAVEDGVTVVEVTVPADTSLEWLGLRYDAGDVVTITLNDKYQTAQISSVDNGDLTGARILSDKKISAFSGNVRTSVDGISRDHLVDQLPPMVQWGFTYCTVRTPGRTADRADLVRVVAHLDNTVVQVQGALNQQFVLNAGEYKELSTTGALYIDSGNQSVMVGVISTSQSTVNSDSDEGDPSMVIMPALGQYSNNYIFSTPSYIKPASSQSSQYDIYVLMIAKTAEVDGLKLNGESLVNPSWSVIAGSEYSFGKLSVDNDKTYALNHLDADVKFMALLYGSADRESFYFPIDVGQANINVITPVSVVGNKGEKGARGAKGLEGVQGPKGFRGATGSTGMTGSRGEMGEKGAKGEAGSPSQIGATGATGATGSSGLSGEVGATGLRGDVGATGATGATGSQGEEGEKGQSGSTGDRGVIGDVGPAGAPGADGLKGVKGAKGVTGAQGVKGPTGPQGEKGYVAAPDCTRKCLVKDAPMETAGCRTTFGTVQHLCSCPAGFHLLEGNPNLCVDIDECDLELCSHSCENVIGSYICTCPAGYSSGTKNNCVDIDECENSPCGTDVCVNGIGSYICIPPSRPETQARKSGLQMLFSPDYFIALFVLLLLLTLIIIILAVCLLCRLRNRNRVQRLNKFPGFYPTQPPPASVILRDNNY